MCFYWFIWVLVYFFANGQRYSSHNCEGFTHLHSRRQAAGLLEMNSQARTKGADKHQIVQLCCWDISGRAYLQEVQRFLGQVKRFPWDIIFWESAVSKKKHTPRIPRQKILGCEESKKLWMGWNEERIAWGASYSQGEALELRTSSGHCFHTEPRCRRARVVLQGFQDRPWRGTSDPFLLLRWGYIIGSSQR